MDDLDAILGNHADDLEALREENLTLQTQLEDYKNILHIRGIPESVLDLQSTITALFLS